MVENVEPAADCALSEAGAGVVDFSLFDRLVKQGLPLWTKLPIIQINTSLSNKIIPKQIIIIIRLNLNRICSWEDSTKLIALVKLWIGLI